MGDHRPGGGRDQGHGPPGHRARIEGVAIEDTVCVGDWINDVPMFELAGRSFVMGQAPAEVKARATDVLRARRSRGGVARAIELGFGIA